MLFWGCWLIFNQFNFLSRTEQHAQQSFFVHVAEQQLHARGSHEMWSAHLIISIWFFILKLVFQLVNRLLSIKCENIVNHFQELHLELS